LSGFTPYLPLPRCQLIGKLEKDFRSPLGPTLLCEVKNIETCATRHVLVICEKHTAPSGDSRRQVDGVWNPQILRRPPSRRLDEDFEADGDHCQTATILNGLAASGFFGAVAVAKWFYEQFGQCKLAGHAGDLALFDGSEKNREMLDKWGEPFKRIDEYVCIEIRSTALQRV
jgi:hypothetical protein